VKKIRNEVPIQQHLLHNPQLLSQVSISLGSSLVRIDNFLLGLIYVFDQMLDVSFFGGGSWLNFFCFLDMNEPPLRNAVPKDSEVSILWPMNGARLATEDWYTGSDWRYLFFSNLIVRNPPPRNTDSWYPKDIGFGWVVPKQRNSKKPRSIWGVVLHGGSSYSGLRVLIGIHAKKLLWGVWRAELEFLTIK